MPNDEQELPVTQPQINLVIENFVFYLRHGEVERALNQMYKISKLLPKKVDADTLVLSITEGFKQSSLSKKDPISNTVTVSKEDKEMFRAIANFPELTIPDGGSQDAQLSYASFTFCFCFMQFVKENNVAYKAGESQPYDEMTDTEKDQLRLAFESQSYLGSIFSSYRKKVDEPYAEPQTKKKTLMTATPKLPVDCQEDIVAKINTWARDALNQKLKMKGDRSISGFPIFFETSKDKLDFSEPRLKHQVDIKVLKIIYEITKEYNKSPDRTLTDLVNLRDSLDIFQKKLSHFFKDTKFHSTTLDEFAKISSLLIQQETIIKNKSMKSQLSSMERQPGGEGLPHPH